MSPEEQIAYFKVAKTCEVDGDIVECGVYNGDSLCAITSALPGRRVWAYDSFEGFPPGNPLHDDPVALGLAGAVVGHPSQVARQLHGLAGELQIRAGWFAETFLLPLPERIALLSVDCDLYDSVLLTLRTMANRVVSGGIITVDDWTCFEGCRAAVYDWVIESGERPLLTTFGTGQAYWRVS